MGDYSGTGLGIGLVGTGILTAAYLFQRFNGKDCSNPDLTPNFQIADYAGVWYEFAKLPNSFQKGECTTATYTLQEEGSSVEVWNQEYFFDTERRNDIKGEATCSKFVDGDCAVRFRVFQPWGDYRVMATDYKSYSIVYSCTPLLAGAFCFELLWVLARQPYVPRSAEWLSF